MTYKTPHGLDMSQYTHGLPAPAHPMRTRERDYVCNPGTRWGRLVIQALAVGAIAWGCASAALASSVTTTCIHNHYRTSCTTHIQEVPAPITYTADEIAAIKARDDAWRAYCKPHDAVGSDGLLRAVYAHKDCDVGAYR